ncbi:MAG: prepilin-type N-terminal cleavage/methylation domain-containing protein [Deltaproteobacteria bacterium]|nr:prepilin-type N-terminal cleavage/methylation domain-containing protein [Deltaproteobacteria bacterium]
MPARPTRARHGFTLIEIMAVIVIIGLALGLVLPNFAATRSGRLRDRALLVAGRLELARERAVVTATPHRLMIDLEEGTYALDWWVTEDRGLPQSADGAAARPDPVTESSFAGNPRISLAPPTGDVRDYYPIPGKFGALARLGPDYYFQGVDTPEGWIERGSVQIVFERDGTSDYAEIVLMDVWDNAVRLQVQPLLDIVRIRDHEDS